MSGRHGKTLARVFGRLALATSLAGAIATSGTASAQEAIMLETIGAVRMASPEEARQRNAAQEDARSQVQEQPRRAVREAAAH